jgi:hypothetical protein
MEIHSMMNENQTDRQDLSETQAGDAAVQPDAKPIRWWQENDDKYLRANWRRRPAFLIGQALDRTRNAVIARAHRLGLQPISPFENFLQGVGEHKLKSKPKPKPKLCKVSVSVPITPAAKPTIISVFDLKPFDCRWPIGNPGHPDFGFCGAPADAPYGYCPFHRAISKTRQS